MCQMKETKQDRESLVRCPDQTASNGAKAIGASYRGRKANQSESGQGWLHLQSCTTSTAAAAQKKHAQPTSKSIPNKMQNFSHIFGLAYFWSGLLLNSMRFQWRLLILHVFIGNSEQSSRIQQGKQEKFTYTTRQTRKSPTSGK